MKKFYITTAIAYVNAPPHLGFSYELILADIIARWHRLNGEGVFFLTGTDENAQKNEQAAKSANIPIKKFVDQNSKKFLELCKILNISNDNFIRTTDKKHFDISQKIFKKVYDKGDIYKGSYEGYYCEGCEAFLTEKDLINGKCPEHNKEPKLLKEESYFFKMSKYEKKIIELLSKKDFVYPEKYRNEILMRVNKEGLKDLSVSRTNLDWGIPVSFDKNAKIYCWFDALINYLSGVDYPNVKFKKYWPADIHLIGKGINWFHSVIWPSILMSADIELPKKIVVHGYVNLKGSKMSKSLGTIVDPVELIKKYSVDSLRYYLVREIPFGEDGDFSEDALKSRINNELANELGNLVSRTLSLAEKKLNNKVKKSKIELNFNIKNVEDLMNKLELHNVLNEIFKFINECNKYVNDNKVWKLEKKELEIKLYNLLEGLRIISILLSSFIPETSEKINKQLNIKQGKLKDCKFGAVKNYNIKKGEILFKKVI